jgi:hypothetical protein
MLKRARRLRRKDDVIFVAIINNPEIGRLGVPMASARENRQLTSAPTLYPFTLVDTVCVGAPVKVAASNGYEAV